MQDPDFWNRRERATSVSQEAARLRQEIEELEELEREVRDVASVVREIQEEDCASLSNDVQNQLRRIEEKVFSLETRIFLSGEHDALPAIVALHAGAGGVDAMDWTQMLVRMYVRFCERQGWRSEVLDESRGQEAGIKRFVMRVEGPYAYGYLKAEAGVHRLVRISPFDAEKMRHTSFALVEVVPELEETEVDIKENDIRIDTFLASGHGGQSVNTTYSAVRIVHLPTGITVVCQNERSQTQNKERAFKILKSKLHRYYQARQEEERKMLRGEFSEAAWGNHIRSYVLHPYQLVKDHRTGEESSDIEAVLDGNIQPFIEAYLRKKEDSPL